MQVRRRAISQSGSAPQDDLQRIPGVGPSLKQDLLDLGVRRVRDLRGRDPERLYADLELLRGTHVDRCCLYVFRSAVYFASHVQHAPELLRWWNWSDANLAARSRRRRARPGRTVSSSGR